MPDKAKKGRKVMEHSLMEFTKNLADNYSGLSYIFFFISASLQILFPPYPGDTILVFEGYLTSKSYFSTFSIILNAVTATFLSCIILYHISYKLGPGIFSIKFINRYFPEKKITNTAKWFKKYGSPAIFISKFIPGIGSIAIISAGVFKVPRFKAYAAMGCASAVNNTLLVIMGRTAGNNMDLIKRLFREYNTFLVIAVILCAAYYLYKRLSRREKQSGNDS